MDDIKILSELYAGHYGCIPKLVTRLGASGGDRTYYRMQSDAGSCIGTVGDSENDCRAFIALSDVFASAGVSVPRIYSVSDDGMHYIQEDLGDVSLFSLLGLPEWYGLASQTIAELVRLHTVPESEWSGAVGYRPFSRRQVLWDLNYFKYEYLKPCGIPFDEDKLQDDFERFAADVDSPASGPRGFMMRDCQSRNVMIYGNKPYLIDFQGGRCGPVVYDLVSFLWQAKARISPDVRSQLVCMYAESYSEVTGTPAEVIVSAVPMLAMFRTLQVLGAYGFRGLVQKRAHFIESIPPGLEHLGYLCQQDFMNDYPELQRVCCYAVNHSPVPPGHEGLLVKVFSFSYKRGYPLDMTGNGGGFMFDCRGMHNPGRYEEYKSLTGLDRPVREFLESRGEVQPYIARSVEIVSPAIETYLRRGFSDLQVGFGCTGGRHRSVYCADGFARAVAEKYPAARIMVIHREQAISEEL